MKQFQELIFILLFFSFLPALIMVTIHSQHYKIDRNIFIVMVLWALTVLISAGFLLTC